MIVYKYMGIEVTKDQEPTVNQIRQLMEITNQDYYTSQEDLRQVSYGDPPHGYNSWLEYFNGIES